MKATNVVRGLVLLLGVAAVATGPLPGCATEEEPVPPICDAGDEAFVSRALVALDGRRPASRAEVQAWTEVIQKLVARDIPLADARKVVARAIMADDDTYLPRWSAVVMDALQVVRALFVREGNWDKVQAKQCYDVVNVTDGGTLASWVRDHSPLDDDPPVNYFNLGQLLSSSLVLDDLTPIYRGQLFHMLQYPMAGANVDMLSLEAARRTDFSTIFSDAFIHRDTACLYCHNSESSVTDNADPALDRSWPVQGRFEQAIYGSAQAEDDPQRYDAVFRVTGVRIPFTAQGGGGFGPWGWDINKCGRYEVPLETDPLAQDAYFASVRGSRASVWDLEASMNKGFKNLRGVGLVPAADGSIDPDSAFAYLVAMNIVNKVWTEVMGSSLTIANYLPRNQSQRDTLQSLTDTFVKSGYSLRTLLAEIVTNPDFNLPASEAACGDVAYSLAATFNPWSADEPDPARRGNSAGDIVHALHTRELQRTLYLAMDWGPPPAFPDTTEDEAFLATIGSFIASFKPGFRGLGFQAKLAWEDAYGTCQLHGNDDYITHLVVRAQTVPGATLQDAVLTLKDRLIGESFLDELELAPVEALAGLPLSTPITDIAGADLDRKLRLVCGAYVSSPQFLLEGFAPAIGPAVPVLTAPEHGYAPSCDAIAGAFDRAALPFVVSCLGDSLTVRTR